MRLVGVFVGAVGASYLVALRGSESTLRAVLGFTLLVRASVGTFAGIAVAILHPGLVRTRMIHFNPHGISPEEAVRGLLARIDALNLENSGTFWHANGEVLPW